MIKQLALSGVTVAHSDAADSTGAPDLATIGTGSAATFTCDVSKLRCWAA